MDRAYTEKQPQVPGLYVCIATRAPELVAGRIYLIDYDWMGWDDDPSDLRVFIGDVGGTIRPVYGKWREPTEFDLATRKKTCRIEEEF